MPTADATGCADGQVLGAGAIRAYLQTEEEAVIEEEPVAGAVPVLDVLKNLTYADVRILPRTGGKVKIK